MTLSTDIIISIITFLILAGLLYYLDYQYSILKGNFVKVILFLGGIFTALLVYLSLFKKDVDVDTSEEEENIKKRKEDINELADQKEDHKDEIKELEEEIKKSKEEDERLKNGFKKAREEFDKNQKEGDKDQKERKNFEDPDDAASYIDRIISGQRDNDKD